MELEKAIDLFVFLLSPQDVLMNVNQMSAEYLFQQDKHYELTLDTGDKTIQCGRHIDILKLWLAWKGRGHSGYAEHVEVLVERAQFFYETIRARQPYFRLIMKVTTSVFPSSINDSFSHRLSTSASGTFRRVYTRWIRTLWSTTSFWTR